MTQNFDRATVVPFELDESTKINVTKRCIQLLNFGGRIFAQNVASHVFGTIPFLFFKGADEADWQLPLSITS